MAVHANIIKSRRNIRKDIYQKLGREHTIDKRGETTTKLKKNGKTPNKQNKVTCSFTRLRSQPIKLNSCSSTQA